MTWIEAIATLFGILAVWLVVRRHIWCWPTGLVQVTLYVWIFWQVRLYSDMILHILYIFMQLYGWYHWLHGRKDRQELPITRHDQRGWLWIVAAIIGTALWGMAMAHLTDAALPYPDAFTTVASLIAQWLTARKKLESWLWWIAVDVVAVFVYWIKELYFTAGLYVIFLGLATLGYIEWRKAWKNATAL